MITLYNNDYVEKFCYKRDNKHIGCDFEICFEKSPDSQRIFEYLQNKIDEQSIEGLTKYALILRERMYGVSFVNKNARYMGVEFADLISYGHRLAIERRVSKNSYYAPIWKVVQKRERELRNLRGFNPKIIIK